MLKLSLLTSIPQNCWYITNTFTSYFTCEQISNFAFILSP